MGSEETYGLRGQQQIHMQLGGLNEFDYINKVIEMYDIVTDRWSMVRASQNILEEMQILEDAQAIQINDDQIYIFGGKNANKYFVFDVDSTPIRTFCWWYPKLSKRKGAAKVTG